MISLHHSIPLPCIAYKVVFTPLINSSLTLSLLSGTVESLTHLSSPLQVLVFHVVRGPFVEEFYQCVTYGLYSPAWLEKLYAVFSLVCMFVLPLLILLLTYISTFITLHSE